MSHISTILCPVDFSTATPFVVEYVKKLAASLQARVVLLHVTRPMQRFAALEVSVDEIVRFAQVVREGAQKNMAQLMAEEFAGLDAEGRVEIGYPVEVILDVSKEVNADLILMATHGYAGLKRIVFGSVAENVVKKSNVPVLTVRPYHPADD